MRATAGLALTLLTVSAPIAAEESAATSTLEVGDEVPELALSSIDGEPFELSPALAQGPVVLVLYEAFGDRDAVVSS